MIGRRTRSARRLVPILGFVFLSGVSRADENAAPNRPVLIAPTRVGDIHVDGSLDETAWRNAGLIPDLIQQAPRPGDPTPYRTQVRVLVDSEALYVGIICADPEPSRIGVHTLQRDGDMSGDDRVALVFDTFNDRRGYYFRVNAAGARGDGLISGPGETSDDWDGVWDAAVRQTDTGWTAEIRIPAATLRFEPHARSWGFNVERTIARHRLTLRWAATTLDSRLDDLSRAGVLEGVSEIRQGLGISMAPYALLNATKDRTKDDRFLKGQWGGDVRYSLTPQLDAILTVNPDFAETEADARQINLTRFPLFFPEKRGFFLEGSNVFRYGLGLAGDFIPFYSRRIGLLDEQLVPLLGGVKVLGQAGRLGIAALDVEADRSQNSSRTNLMAGRVTYDIDEHLRAGTVVTNGDPSGLRSNTLAGLDAIWRTSQFHGDENLFLGAWGAVSAGDVGSGRRSGFGVKVDYPNDLWDLAVRFDDYGQALDPALGFLPRPGTRQYQFSGAYQPRPEGGIFRWVRQFFFELESKLVTDLHGVAETWRFFTAPFNVRTQSGEHLEANWAPEFERLFQPFEIAPGVVIPAGSYRFHRFRTEAQSSEHRPWRVGATLWSGGFYTGHLTQVSAFANWTSPAGRVSGEVSAENDFGRLPQGNFIERLWQAKAVYAFSTDLILATYLQYDSNSRAVGMNARLRWTVNPGNDVFLVWNRGWRSPAEGNSYNLDARSDRIVLKARWTFRP